MLIFDVKDPKQAVMIHSVRVTKPDRRTRIPIDFVNQMDLDTDRSTLICRSKLGLISVVILISRSIVKSEIIERINSYEGSRDEHQTSFRWLSRMNSYVEGTDKGYLRVRDLGTGGECMLTLQTTFSERVQMIHYNKAKNVLFAASREGKFSVWKIPHEWRSKVIDDREQDAEFERRRQ